MTRFLRISVGLITVVLVGGFLVWWLSFRAGNRPPTTLRIAGMEGTGTVTWIEDGDAMITLEDERDIPRAMGAVHALSRPWLLLLMRQAALGRLSEWYGRQTLSADLHVHRMGLPVSSRAALADLDPVERDALDAYADGVNAAFATRRIRLAPAVAALDIHPEPWEAWHALAIERLVAWLASTPEVGPHADDPAVRAFLAARDSLGMLLGLGGLDHGAAWSMAEQPPGLFVRLVYGSTGVPPVLLSAVETPDGQAQLLTWLGMPAAWAGRNADCSWAVLPSGHAVIDTGRVAADPVYVALRLRDGSRDVATRVSSGIQAVFGSGYRVTWSGMAPISDLSAIQAIAEGGAPAFRLIDGLAMTRDLRRTGPPRTFGGRTTEVGQVVLVSSAAEALELARSLDPLVEVGAEEVFGHAGTSWARQAAESLVARLRAEASATTLEGESMTYLAGWDGAFDGSSIGAVIFHGVSTEGDSTRTFLAAMSRLTRRFGTERREWRWERDGGDIRYPGWAEGQDLPDAVRLPSRYAPVAIRRHGHPTAPSWASATPWVDPPAPAAWEGFIEDRAGGLVSFRRPTVPYDRLLGRFSSDPGDARFDALPGRPALGERTRLIPDS